MSILSFLETLEGSYSLSAEVWEKSASMSLNSVAEERMGERS